MTNLSSQPPTVADPVALEGSVPFDRHGIDPIPEADRDASPGELFWIWAGANIAPINWVLGALGIALGLGLRDTLLVIVLGNVVGCAIFGLFNVMGHRTGVNQMLIGRAPFGIRGAVFPGLIQGLLTMAWVGVNTWVVLDLALALLGEFGIHGGDALRYAVAATIMVAQLLLALYGFYAIRTFEKWTVPATVLVMAVMTLIAVSQADISWAPGQAETTADKVTAITQLVTAIGVGWGISWIPYSADYSRFVSVKASPKAVFWASSLGMFVPTVWLAALGAFLASAGGNSDPSTLVVGTFGVMAVPVLLLIMHGPVAGNILNLYSCSLAAMSVGIHVARWTLTLTAGIVASVVLAVFVQADDFAHSFDNWMVSILVWISPWAAVVLVDYFMIRRGRLDVPSLYLAPGRSRYGAYNLTGAVSLLLGLVAAWAWQFGLVPAMQGPVATALGNTDFSWLSGGAVAGLVYFALNRDHPDRRRI